MNDVIYRQAAIDVAKAHWYKPDIVGAIEQLPPAEPEPYLDSIVSEIEKTISETRESGKHHDINVRTNGAMICFGLQLALEIIEEIRNDKAKEDGKTT